MTTEAANPVVQIIDGNEQNVWFGGRLSFDGRDTEGTENEKRAGHPKTFRITFALPNPKIHRLEHPGFHRLGGGWILTGMTKKEFQGARVDAEGANLG